MIETESLICYLFELRPFTFDLQIPKHNFDEQDFLIRLEFYLNQMQMIPNRQEITFKLQERIQQYIYRKYY